MVSAWHFQDEGQKGCKTHSVHSGRVQRRLAGGTHVAGLQGSLKRELLTSELETFRQSIESGDGLDVALAKIRAGQSVYKRWKKENEDFRQICEAYLKKHKARRKGF